MTPKCPACAHDISAGAISCPACGADLDSSFADTRLLDHTPPAAQVAHGTGGPTARTKSPRASAAHDSLDSGRFLPGTTLAGRYRIVSLLGRGGMGEVYRADDLKLEQPVALKFLPETLTTDGAALARFHREVRVARQISHRNVCRVHDIGEAEGQHFLSMEYVKGEELASLLRRIGRLPADKATEVARQLCAGLAAAHDAGVLHRDLKPANVMLDERGNVRVTDFGLAGLAEELRDADIISGTPAYMAPEQLAGTEVTTRSDIYALGLVLYEIFTGRRAFDARTLDELLKLRQSDPTPASPSSLVKDIDPLVERVIERCLAKDPDKRPASALQVAAALPGGDPLAAALAAGETPSPEMVAAAPRAGALKPVVAVALLAAFGVVLALCCWLTKYSALYRLTPLDKSPEVLRERARDIIKHAGYTAAPADSAHGTMVNFAYLQYVLEHDQTRTRWARLRTDAAAGYRFWYRQSPRYLVTREDVTFEQPAQAVSGMTGVYLDMQGHLHYFVGVPPQREAAPQSPRPAPDWSHFFNAAGLDQTRFQPVASTWVPPYASDARAAWDGSDPAQPEHTIHVEAAAFAGQPVYFETIYPWDHPARQEETQVDAATRILTYLVVAIFMLVLVGSALLAFKNLRLGRGDRRGAFRLAGFYLALRMVQLIFDAHHVGEVEGEFFLIIQNIEAALFTAAFMWLLYVALEPFVRRRWPGRIIAWSRLLAGDWRDPLVGRDILIGALVGSGLILTMTLANLAPGWLGRPPIMPITPDSHTLGLQQFITKFVTHINGSINQAFVFLFLLLLFYAVLRRERLAAAALLVFATFIFTLSIQSGALGVPFAFIFSLLCVGVLYRHGLLALVSAMLFLHLWVFYPMTTELTAWYATDFTLALVACVALALYGFYISLAGQPLFRRSLLED